MSRYRITSLRRHGAAALLALIGLLLTACGASAPAADRPSTTSGVAQAEASAAPQPTIMPTAMPSPTAMPTTMPSPTAMPAATATSASMAGHSHGTMSTGAMAGGEQASTEIKLFTFAPIEVRAGTTVTWTNGDDIGHSVTSGAPPTGDGTFDSGLFEKGQTFAFAFTTPGEYAYFCTRHNSMVGVVRVTE